MYDDKPPRRAHRPTGKKPPGGARERAGKPKGSTNPLPLNAIPAIKACRIRIPDGTSPEAEALATRGLQKIVDVMEGKVRKDASTVLKAAAIVRQEICGPVAQKMEHSGGVSIEVVNPYSAAVAIGQALPVIRESTPTALGALLEGEDG